jgi:hypothetical protein
VAGRFASACLIHINRKANCIRSADYVLEPPPPLISEALGSRRVVSDNVLGITTPEKLKADDFHPIGAAGRFYYQRIWKD